MVLQRNQQIGRKNKHIFERFTYHLRASIPPNFAYRFHLDFMHLMHRFYPDFACQIHLNFAHGFHLDFARRFYLDFANRFHLDFVGATSGRPPKNERIARITDLFARVTVRKIAVAQSTKSNSRSYIETVSPSAIPAFCIRSIAPEERRTR